MPRIEPSRGLDVLKYVLAAVTVALFAFSGAKAAPQASSLKITPAVAYGDSSDLLVEVKKKRYRHYKHYKHNKHYKHHKYDRYYNDRHYRYRYDRDRYYRHRHYRRPPPGWNRYHYRPYGWSRRGCIAFGPVWYCP